MCTLQLAFPEQCYMSNVSLWWLRSTVPLRISRTFLHWKANTNLSMQAVLFFKRFLVRPTVPKDSGLIVDVAYVFAKKNKVIMPGEKY